MVDIWEAATSHRQREGQLSSKEDVTLLVLGNKNSGKTTAIYRFLNRDEAPKPTVALEFTFGRQSRSHVLSKDVCQIWELGGGTLFLDLLPLAITVQNLPNLVVCIVVDLSRPQELMDALTKLLTAVRDAIQQVLAQEGAQGLESRLKEATDQRFATMDHQDRDAIDPLPVPLVILGGKYDLFQNYEPVQCELIARALRHVAHVNGATLQFFSSRMENLVTRTRALLSHLVFGTTFPNYISQDHTKPLMIPAGADSLQQIGSCQQHGDKKGTSSWIAAFLRHFPQAPDVTQKAQDPAKDPNFKEPIVDNLRAQKDEEFESFLRTLNLSGP